MIILTSKTAKYSERPLITNNNDGGDTNNKTIAIRFVIIH